MKPAAAALLAFVLLPGLVCAQASATPFLVHNIGTPRTFHVSYSFNY